MYKLETASRIDYVLIYVERNLRLIVIQGCDGRRAYIATQGPKLSTLNEFWQMTYEQNIRVILNLTLLEERGKVKCEQYWPSFGSMQYGDIQVQLLNETNNSCYCTRDLLMIHVRKLVSFI